MHQIGHIECAKSYLRYMIHSLGLNYQTNTRKTHSGIWDYSLSKIRIGAILIYHSLLIQS